MLIVAGQIIFWLALAAALGLIIGWHLRAAFSERQLRDAGTTRENESIPAESAAAAKLAHIEAQTTVHIEEMIPVFAERTVANALPAARVTASAGAVEIAPAPEPAFALSPTPRRDDLKRIHGIGPKFERKLNDLGINTFRQVALWSQVDIESVAAQIQAFPERIRHQNWMRSAKEQHLLKYGERL